MFHDPRLFEALESSRPAIAPTVGSRRRVGPDRPAIAPLALGLLTGLSLGLWVTIAYVAHLI